MKISGIFFFVIAFIMAVVMPHTCLCDEPALKSSQQIVFDIDGANASIKNACPDEDQIDCYDQYTDESYEDEADSDADEDEENILSYDILNDIEEDDDESDLEEAQESFFVESIKKYTTEQVIEKKSLIAEDQTEQIDQQEDTTPDTIDFEQSLIATEGNSSPSVQKKQGLNNEYNQTAQLTHATKDDQQLDTGLFMDEEIDAQGNNVLDSTQARDFDLMDYIQSVVLGIKNRIKTWFV